MNDPLLLRPLTSGDLPAAEALQLICYPPALRDSAAAFASRIAIAGHCCVVASSGGALLGYILAHPWPSGAPPVPDQILEDPIPVRPIHYIHDLSVAPEGRGRRIGARLVAASQAMAAGQGINRSELVAIGGAAPYWHARGYCANIAGGGLAAKLAAYGPGAAYMFRDLDPLMAR